MRITILGSGQDGGLPQLGSDHPHDGAARAGDLLERTASSVLVEADGRRLLLDASPDLRIQWWAFHGLPDAIALTHAHAGHFLGLAQLGHEAAAAAAVPLFASDRMGLFLEEHEPWRSLVRDGHLALRRGLRHDWDGVELTLVPVPHRGELSDTVAVSVGGRVLYLPDIDRWDRWPEARSVIGSHDLALLDGTFWSPDELPPGRMETVPHPPVPETMALVEGLETTVVLTHLNHTNPLCDPSSEKSAAVLAAGLMIAHDGLVIDL